MFSLNKLFLIACIIALANATAIRERRSVCDTGNHLCDSNAACTEDTTEPNGYSCSCNSGFTGDGFQCTDIDECATNNGGCQMGCDNRPGTRWCTCPEDYAKISETNCQADFTVIKGTVFASTNTSHVHANVPSFLYLSTRRDPKYSLLNVGTTNSLGEYSFNVGFGKRYQVCVIVDGFESCVMHRVPSITWFNSGTGGQTRRTTDLSQLNIPVPSYLYPGEYEIQLIWAMDVLSAHCDYDTALLTPYDSTCIAAYKDTDSYGYCCDPLSSSCERYAMVYDDSSCTYDTYGFETIRFAEPGTNTYKHFVYGYDSGSSFDIVNDMAQAQINVYRRGVSGLPFLQSTISLSNAIFGSQSDRFWHTFTLTTSNGAFGSISEVNVVSCTPEESTGTTDTLTFENGSRGC